MSNSPTVTLRYAQAIVQASERLRVELPAQLLTRLRSYPARVPLALQDELWHAICARSDDPLIGLRIGMDIQVGHLDSAGLLLMSCETLGEALDALLEYFPIIGEGSVLEAHDESGSRRLHYLPGYQACLEPRAEAVIGCLVHLSNWTTGGQFTPAEVRIAHSPRDRIGRYQSLLSCAIEFEATGYSLLLRERDLAIPLIQANADLREHLQEAADRMLASLSADSLSSQVEILIRHQPRWGKERIAELLGLSGRHLNRKLAEEGTSFKLLRDATLQRLAAQRLDGNERVRDIAKGLGFSDESAFAKAFRRWFGLSPAQFRERAHKCPR